MILLLQENDVTLESLALTYIQYHGGRENEIRINIGNFIYAVWFLWVLFVPLTYGQGST